MFQKVTFSNNQTNTDLLNGRLLKQRNQRTHARDVNVNLNKQQYHRRNFTHFALHSANTIIEQWTIIEHYKGKVKVNIHLYSASS